MKVFSVALLVLLLPSTGWASSPLPLVASFNGVDTVLGDPAPDATIAAGPTTLVVARNNKVAILDKTGTLLHSKTLREFFAPVTSLGPGDPNVLFDLASNRFFFVAAAAGADPNCLPGACVSYHLVAVSKTANPTLDPSDWYFYALDRTLDITPEGRTFTANWGDFDHLAVYGDTLVITSRMYRFRDGAPQGPKIRLLDKLALISGQPVTTWTDFVGFEPHTYAGILPAIAFENPRTVFLVSRGGTGSYWPRCTFTVWAISNPLTGPTLISREVVTGRTCDVPIPDALQPDGEPPLSIAIIGFNTQPVYRNGSLWVAHTVGANFGSGDVSAIHWVHIDVSAWPDSVTVAQDAIFGTDGTWHFAAAIMVDSSNNLAMVYARSSSTEFPSAYYTGRLAIDPANTLRPGAVLKAGVATFSQIIDGRNPFTDYFGIASDPLDATVWMMGFYTKVKNVTGTWVGNVTFEPPDVPKLTLSLNGINFRPGDTMILTATATPGDTPWTVDAYLAVRLPDGTLLFYPSLTTALQPVVTNWTVAPFAGEVFRYTFTGVEPPSSYTWLAAFTEPGTLNIIGGIAQAPFSFSP